MEYAKLERKYRDIKNKVDDTADEIARRRIIKSRISDILQILDGMETGLTEFDNEMFIMLVNRITVYSKVDVRVRFINGNCIGLYTGSSKGLSFLFYKKLLLRLWCSFC